MPTAGEAVSVDVNVSVAKYPGGVTNGGGPGVPTKSGVPGVLA